MKRQTSVIHSGSRPLFALSKAHRAKRDQFKGSAIDCRQTVSRRLERLSPNLFFRSVVCSRIIPRSHAAVQLYLYVYQYIRNYGKRMILNIYLYRERGTWNIAFPSIDDSNSNSNNNRETDGNPSRKLPL